MSCVHIDHLGTLIQRELARTNEHDSAIDLAESARLRAQALRNELRQHGARNSNAHLDVHQIIQISADLPNQWAEICAEIHRLGTLIGREIPRDIAHTRAIDLASRATRRAWEIFSDLIHHGAKTTTVYPARQNEDDARGACSNRRTCRFSSSSPGPAARCPAPHRSIAYFLIFSYNVERSIPNVAAVSLMLPLCRRNVASIACFSIS